MKYLNIYITIFFLITLISCKNDLQTCDCNRIDVFGHFTSINFPIRQLEQRARDSGFKHQILDSDKIESIKNLILELKYMPEWSVSETYGGIDVELVLDFNCINGGKSTILLNKLVLQNGNRIYEQNEKLVDILSRLK